MKHHRYRRDVATFLRLLVYLAVVAAVALAFWIFSGGIGSSSR
jgi:hypothetical protein